MNKTILLCGLTAAFLFMGSLRAGEVTWTGAVSSDWSNADNWLDGIKAVASDTVIFQAGGYSPNINPSGSTSYTVTQYNGGGNYSITRSGTGSLGQIRNLGSGVLFINTGAGTKITGGVVRSGTVVFSGTIDSGNGNLTLIASDATTVVAPMLVFNGFATTSAAITVGGNQQPATITLAGTGTIKNNSSANGYVNISGPSSRTYWGTIISPGDPLANRGIGKFTIDSTLSMGAGQSDRFNRFDFQLESLSSYDQLVVTGKGRTSGGNTYGMSIGANTKLNLIFDADTIQAGAYDLITYGGRLDGFSSLGFYADTQTLLSTLTQNGLTYELQNVFNVAGDNSQGGVIRFLIIPEPSSLLLMLGGGAALLALAGRRRKS